MGDSGGLVYAYLLDGKGGGRALDWTGVEEEHHGVRLLWMHLDYRATDAMEWLENKSGIGAVTRESLLAQGTRPRSILSDQGMLLILRGVNCNPGEDPEDMVSLRMLFSEHRIITLRHQRVMAIQDIAEAIAQGEGPADAGGFLAMVAERIGDRMGDVVADLDDRVDELEDSVLDAESQVLRTQLSTLRRQAIGLRRYIAPQRDVLSRLLHEKPPWLGETDRGRLREVAERTARFVEDVDSARDRAAITQEELNSRLSDQMNKAMYLLSIVAAIFLPLGLLTGLLGINVGGIPGAENQWGFSLVTVLLVALAFGLVAWFKRIKWL